MLRICGLFRDKIDNVSNLHEAYQIATKAAFNATTKLLKEKKAAVSS